MKVCNKHKNTQENNKYCLITSMEPFAKLGILPNLPSPYPFLAKPLPLGKPFYSLAKPLLLTKPLYLPN
jgi:hypothetical protein